MTLQSEIELKRRELQYLKDVSGLTQRLKTQLDELSVQVAQMNTNTETAKEVMSNWDSVLRSVSQASISLLQYTENDYETGKWASKSTDHKGTSDKARDSNVNKDTGKDVDASSEALVLEPEPPMPETLVRVKITDDTS